MNKIMPLEILSSINGARPSESIEELFKKVKNAFEDIENDVETEINDKIMDIDSLREDIVIETDEDEIKILIQNFPVKKDNYLVVPRVIEK